MKAIVVTNQAAGTAGMKLADRPEPQAAINDVVVQVHASGFVGTELAWPSTWTDRLGRDRTPSIPGHELAGVVNALGYGTTGLSVGQRVFGLTDWTRDGTLAEYAAVEARNLAPLPGDVDFTVGASLPILGLTAWRRRDPPRQSSPAFPRRRSRQNRLAPESSWLFSLRPNDGERELSNTLRGLLERPLPPEALSRVIPVVVFVAHVLWADRFRASPRSVRSHSRRLSRER